MTPQERKVKLEQVRAALKTEFFGIDEQIDSIIDSIKTWYLLPEIVTRPIIVSLWGLTGCGKTALLRSLVAHLEFTSRFLEIQMDSTSVSSSADDSLREILCKSSIPEGGQGIILLDEFQRFRTIDQQGMDIQVKRFHDVWMLLSDGMFPSDYESLVNMEDRMVRWDYWDDQLQADAALQSVNIDDDPEQKKHEEATRKHEKRMEMAAKIYLRKYYTTRDEAEQLKMILRLKESIIEVMTWTKDKVRSTLRSAIEKKYIPPYDFSKCLIFVAGNLDEAFRIADDVEDCDTSADIFHAYTKKIGSIEVKKALLNRFKPEQIARLGNNSVVYPSLTKEAYLKIIRRSCLEYTNRTEQAFGISFEINESVYQEIYDNSVFPTQGTRPVFTSIHKLFGSPISDAIFWAKENNFNVLKIDLNIVDSALIFSSGGKECRVKVDFELRRRRTNYSKDYNALVAVHEAGHALVYAELFKAPPVELAISVASFKGGYNQFTTEFLSKQETLSRISVGMAGIVAEEMIFGQEMRSTGCSNDVNNATIMAGSYVRLYAMDGIKSKVVDRSQPGGSSFNNDIDGTNPQIEQIMEEQTANAQTILTKHRELLVDLARELVRVKKMDANQFTEFLGDRIAGFRHDEERDVNGDYARRLEVA